MTIVETTARFITGLRNIENAIRLALQEELPGAVPTFAWNQTAGGVLVPPPDTVSLEVFLQGRRFSGPVSRDQVEASAKRVERADVVTLVAEVVSALHPGAA